MSRFLHLAHCVLEHETLSFSPGDKYMMCGELTLCSKGHKTPSQFSLSHQEEGRGRMGKKESSIEVLQCVEDDADLSEQE